MNQSIQHSAPNGGAHPHAHAQNGHHPNGAANHSGPVWDFLTATRDRAAFNSIRDKRPDFDLRDVAETQGAASLIWGARCEHDEDAVKSGHPLDEVVARTLGVLSDANPDALEALEWLCDPNATFYDPSDAPKVAARLAKAWSEPAKAPRFEFTLLSELRARPRPDEVVEDFLVAETAVIFSGESQSLKTFAALGVALCVATGTPWQGRKVKRGPVVYIAAEGGWTLRDRIEAWEIEHGITVSDEDFHLLEAPVSMGDAATVVAFSAFIEEKAPLLVVIDTLSACAAGLKENANEDMATFVRHMKAISKTSRATSIAIHHNNKSGGLRGGGALENDADTRVTFERQGDDDTPVTVVSCAKHRAKRFPAFALRGEEVTLSELDKRGRPVTSLVLSPCEMPEEAPKKPRPQTARANETRAQLLSAFDALALENDGVKIGTWAGNVIQSEENPNGFCGERTFWRYLKIFKGEDDKRTPPEIEACGTHKNSEIFRRAALTATTARSANGSSDSEAPNTELLTARTATTPLGGGSSGSDSKDAEKTGEKPKARTSSKARKAEVAAQSEPYQSNAPTASLDGEGELPQ
jgi:hypothetical protein